MFLEALCFFRFALSKRNRKDTLYQCYIVGVKSLFVVTVVGLFTGMILSLNAGLKLMEMGQQNAIADINAIATIREMGPFMAGLIISASVGSAMAAQLGTMTVSEEVSALEVMGINTNRFLVMPRLFALAFMMPLITLYVDIVAIIGGALVGSTQLNIDPIVYFRNAFSAATVEGLYIGLFKSIIFGLVIGTIACFQGLSAKNGATGVGLVTRKTVVLSFLLMLILGFILTRIFSL